MANKAKKSKPKFSGNSKKQNSTNRQYEKRTANAEKRLNRDANLRADESQNPKNYVNRVMNSSNDFSWYNNVPGIIGDATHISWFNQLGAKVAPFGTQDTEFRVPGIMVFDTVTSPGLSKTATSGASLAGLQMYDAIRRSLNKPNPDYEAQDTLMVMLACDDIYAQYINILRAFGIVHTYSGDNLYTPQTLMAALYGWTQADFMEFLENEANYRAYFNTLIYKASSFIFYPKDFSITDRHAWLFGKLFKDHDDTDKYQLYAFRKHNNWILNETMSEEGTALEYKPVDLSAGGANVNAMLQQFDDCIEALRSSTLVRQLFADMRQAFGDTTSLMMGRVDETFYITPDYDMNALMQIENMDINFVWDDLVGNDSNGTYHVKQDVDKNILIWAPFLPLDLDPEFNQLALLDRIVNTHTQDESSETVAEATRLMVPWIEDVQGGEAGLIPVVTADFVCNAYYYNNPDVPVEHKLRTLIRSTTSLATYKDWCSKDLVNWSMFDWAPKMFFADIATGQATKFQPILECDHYTVIGAGDNNSVLQRLNTACNLSMWAIPEWGTWKT